MARWIAARGQLALVFWMPFAFCGLGRCRDIRDRNAADFTVGNACDAACEPGNRALDFGARSFF